MIRLRLSHNVSFLSVWWKSYISRHRVNNVSGRRHELDGTPPCSHTSHHVGPRHKIKWGTTLCQIWTVLTSAVFYDYITNSLEKNHAKRLFSEFVGDSRSSLQHHVVCLRRHTQIHWQRAVTVNISASHQLNTKYVVYCHCDCHATVVITVYYSFLV